MGRRFDADMAEYYSQLYRMTKNFALAHEGDIEVGAEIVEEMFSREENVGETECRRYFQMISQGLAAHEGGHAAYEDMIRRN